MEERGREGGDSGEFPPRELCNLFSVVSLQWTPADSADQIYTH